MLDPGNFWQSPRELPDLRRVGTIAIDTETNDAGLRADRGSSWPWGDGYVCGISVAWHEGGEIRKIYIPMRHPDSNNFDPAQVYRWLNDHIAAGVRIVTLNGIYDWGWLRTDGGIVIPPSNQLEEVGALATIVDENQRRYSLDALCERYGLPGKDETLLLEGVKALGLPPSRKKVSPREHIHELPARYVGPYAEGDAVNTLLLFEKLKAVPDREGTRDAYRLEVDLMPMVLEMRRRGVRVDQDRAVQSRDLLLGKRDAALAELSDQHGALVGMDEINSAKWKEKTFEQYSLRTPHRTTTGKMSFAKGGGKAGWMITHEHWLPRLISTASKYDGAACKFLQGHILDHIVNGRIYAELHPFKTEDSGTRSFRFSYSEPPLQQIPKRDPEIMPLIRDCFQAEDGEFWATADANQQEFRIFVHEGARRKLPGAHEAAESYRNSPDADFHKMVEDLVKTDRTAAKGINFGNIYGAGVAKLAEMMGKTLEEAQPIIDEYNKRLPFVKKLSAICQNEAERNGYTEMPNGGRRHWNQYEVKFAPRAKDAGPCSLEQARLRVADPEHPWHRKQLLRHGTYKALNALIQGSAAIYTKNWMLACWREGIVPRLQVHDALEVSVKTRQQAEMVAQLGAEAVKLEVPMLIDLKFGRSWGDAKHTWQELTGEPELNGNTHHSATPATKTAITGLAEDVVPTEVLRCEAVMLTDSSDSSEQPAAPDCPGDDIAHATQSEPDTVEPPEPASTAIDKHQIWITVFPDIHAQKFKYRGFLTLRQIAESIAAATAKSKEELPMLKLQRFGDQRTDKNCLRSDANVLEIHGIEGEHDKGTMSFAEATAALHKLNIRCIVYTSPSYIPGTKERWRVLLPTSGPLAPSLRVGLVARLNGIVGGVLAPTESFTLSQSFYFGSVDNNPNHQVRLLDGDFIDLRDDLAAGGPIFKDGSKVGGKSADGPQTKSHADSHAAGERKPSAPWQDPIIGILTGDQLHPNVRDLAAKLVAAGTDPAAVENILRGLMEKSAAPKDARWQERYDDIPRAVSSATGKFAPPPPFDLKKFQQQLKGLGPGGPGVGAGTGSGGVAGGAGGGNPGAGPGTGSTGAPGGGTAPSGTPPLIEARPFVLRDPTTLPKRQWIYGTHLIRKFGSATFAPSGSGKSTLMIIEALAIATGRPLLGILPRKRCRVWYWNGEDPFDELERRVAAACLHYGIDAAELDGWLFINSGRDPNSEVVIATQDRNGTTIAVPVVEALVKTIYVNKIDVAMIDPFISSHQVPENDNNAIDAVAKTWTGIADITDIAIDLAHHTRKTYGAEVTVEDSRGASALLNAVRPARVLNTMTEDEALKGGIADGRKRYFKVTDGKNNLALPLDRLDWFRSESVFLGNGDPGDPSDKGDNVGVVTVWEWPDAMEGVSDADIEKVKEAIRAGEWRKDHRAKDWVGHIVAKALGLGDVRNKGLDRTKVTTLVNTWIYKGVLKVVKRDDERRRPREFVEVAEDGSDISEDAGVGSS